MDARHEIFILLVLGFSKDTRLLFHQRFLKFLASDFREGTKRSHGISHWFYAVHFIYCTFQQHVNSEL